MTKEYCGECRLHLRGLCYHFNHAKDTLLKDEHGKEYWGMQQQISNIDVCDDREFIHEDQPDTTTA